MLRSKPVCRFGIPELQQKVFVTLLCPDYLASCKIQSKFMGKIKYFNPLFFPHLVTGKVQKFAHC
jgi:hypothetical protein